MASKVNKNKAIELRKNGKTLREIGEIFDVTRERIRQILEDVPGLEKHKYPNHIKYPFGYKRCYSCKKGFPFEKFYKSKSGRFGFSDVCIKCTKENVRRYSYKYKGDFIKGGKHYPKMKARIAVAQALKNGKLKKERCLFKEGCSGGIEAHHYLGYEKRNYLDVKWLCRKHHRIVDKMTPFGN